ncbi:hypothetical protein HKBW3S25_01874, partial [Candidatus Hakubella thermalkaliphila]
PLVQDHLRALLPGNSTLWLRLSSLITLFLATLLLPAIPPALHVALNVTLALSGNGQGILGHVLVDAATPGNKRAVGQSYGGDQNTVGTHKNPLSNAGSVLLEAVVVGGDHPGPNIGLLSHLGVTQVSQMPGFGSLAQASVFEFDKIAHVRPFFQMSLGAQAGKRPHLGLAGDVGFIADRVRLDPAARFHGGLELT